MGTILTTGAPFEGKKLDKLKVFLQTCDLDYDEQVTYTANLLDDDTLEIIASGSIHGNVLKCIAVSPDRQGEGLMPNIIINLLEKQNAENVLHNFVFTKPENIKIFKDMGFYEVINTEKILLMETKKNGLNAYLDQLEKETLEVTDSKENIGCIIANCNPFTKGHRFLMETAASQCDYLHVFVLSEDEQMFDSQKRYEMVKRGVEDIPNIIMHKTSDYQISPAVFPTYFIKDKAVAKDSNYILDLSIFSEKIASRLNITKRFVGTEPFCKVTKGYNDCMANFLPNKGIEFIQIERKAFGDNPISATFVRKAIEEKEVELLKEYLPNTTYDYLEEHGYFS